MADGNDIGGKVGLDIGDFKANVAELNRQIKVIDSGFKAAAAGMDDWGKSEQGLQQRISALNQITDLQKQKVQNLTAMYNKIAAEKGENSRAAQDLQVKINKETEALNKNLKELNNVTKNLDSFGKELDQAADKIDVLGEASEDAGHSFKGLASELVKADAIKNIAESAVGMAKSILGFSVDSQKAMNNFQAQTGFAADQMGEFRDIANDIYARNLGESIDDIASSMATINQVTGKTGDELKNATENAVMLRDTFGFEVNESIKAANGLMVNFGISADQAYTLMAQGAQMGANQNGDMLDVLSEYAPHFKALGLSGEEFIDTLIQGSVEGVFSIDKLGDAVKEFTIRSKDGSKTSAEGFKALGFNAETMFKTFAAGGDGAEKAFRQVVEKLNSIDDPLKRNAIGVQLFGTQFEDLEATAFYALEDIENYADSTANTLADINKVKYNDIGSALEGLKRKLLTSLSGPIETEITPRVNDLINSFSSIDLAPIVSGFGWIIDNADSIAAGAVSIGVGMATWNVVSMVSSLVGAIKAYQLANEGATIAQGALNLVMSANPIGIIITLIAALAAGIIYLWNTNEGFRNGLIAAWDAIYNTIMWVVNGVIGFVKNNWQELLLFLVNPIAGAVALLYKLNPKFREWVDSIINTFIGVDWGNIGWSIVMGIANGMGVGPLVEAAAKVAKAALSTIKSSLGIHSPSRVMRDQVGLMIGAGMAEGIEKSQRQVNSAMSALNKQVIADGEVNVKANATGSDNTPKTPKDTPTMPSNEPYVIIQVPVNIDGKQVAEATATYDDKIQGSNLAFASRGTGLK